MTNRKMDSLNTPIYFKLTRIVAVTDILLALTDTVVTALIFFGDDQDTFKSLYYKIVKQQGILVLHSEDEVRWNQNLVSWMALVITTMFNLVWFNSSCYLLYATKKTRLSVGNRLSYCRSWLLISSVLLITYSIHIFTNGQDVPTALLASLVALVYRVFVICIVYGLFLHLEETVRPFFSTPDGIYLEGANLKLRDNTCSKSAAASVNRTSVHLPHQPLRTPQALSQQQQPQQRYQHQGAPPQPHNSRYYGGGTTAPPASYSQATSYGSQQYQSFGSPQQMPRHEYIYFHDQHPGWAFQVRHV